MSLEFVSCRMYLLGLLKLRSHRVGLSPVISIPAYEVYGRSRPDEAPTKELKAIDRERGEWAEWSGRT